MVWDSDKLSGQCSTYLAMHVSDQIKRPGEVNSQLARSAKQRRDGRDLCYSLESRQSRGLPQATRVWLHLPCEADPYHLSGSATTWEWPAPDVQYPAEPVVSRSHLPKPHMWLATSSTQTSLWPLILRAGQSPGSVWILLLGAQTTMLNQNRYLTGTLTTFSVNLV